MTIIKLDVNFLTKNAPELTRVNFEHALALKSDFTEAQVLLGMSLYTLDDKVGAYDHLHSALKVIKASKSSWKELEEILHIQEGEIIDFIAAQVDALRHTSPLLQCRLAREYIENDEEENAVEILQETLELKDDYIEAHFLLGMAYEKLGKLKSSKKHLARTIKLDHVHLLAHFHLGTVMMRLGVWSVVEREFELVAALYPKSQYGEDAKKWLEVSRAEGHEEAGKMWLTKSETQSDVPAQNGTGCCVIT